MSKTLLFSDIHIHSHKKSLERLQHCLDALEWVFKVAKDRQITEIVFCGDLFHDRQKIDILTYQRTFEILEKNLDGKISLYMLLGNHDLFQLSKWDVSSVRPLAALPGVKVIDEPCSIGIEGKVFDFLPYTKDPIAWLDRMNSSRTGRVLCAHLAVDGAQLNTMHNTRADVSVEHDGDMVKVGPEIFKGYEQVFLGHYHGEQKLLENVEYIGSPLQLSFGEAFQFKHIIVYDCDTGEKEYVRNTFSPQHFIIPAADVDKYDLNNNFIRIEVDDLSTTDIVEMRSKIAKDSKVGSLEIKPSDKEERNHIIENARAILNDENEMLVRYIDDVGTEGLDRDRLLEIGKLICTPLTEEELESIS